VDKTEKVAALMVEIRESLARLESNLPRRVDGFALSAKSKLPWKVLLYRESLTWRIAELAKSALDDLVNDKLVSSIVLTRAAIETSAALWFLSAKVNVVVDSSTVGDIDEYLMKLAMGTATGWPETESSDGLTMPRPVKVNKFLAAVDKDIDDFSRQYGILSDYAHPNWAGTVLLYSKTDQKTAITDFGQYMRTANNAKMIGAVNLSVALKIFEMKYSRISEIHAAFCKICEEGKM